LRWILQWSHSLNALTNNAGDMAFVKATCSIGGQDVIEEYMACGLFPLSASFDLGEIADSEMPMSKLALPSPNFPVARFS
jgi:hypothetical protein